MKTAIDVAKALDCCSIGKCSGCSYNMDEHCTYDLPRDAINILSKLQDENTALKAQVQAAEQTIRAITIKLREKEGSNS